MIATRQQVGRPEGKTSKYDDSFLGVAREILDEEGITGLWLGLRAGLVLTVNPAITYGVFERVKGLVLLAKQTTKMGPWLSFIIGAISKTLATVVSVNSDLVSFRGSLPQVTYPYIMAKVKIQARSADTEDAIEHHDAPPKPHAFHHEHSKHVGAVEILARVWRKRGFLGWYQVRSPLTMFAGLLTSGI